MYFAAVTVGLPADVLSGRRSGSRSSAAAFAASLSWQSGLAVFGAALGRGAGHRLHRPTVIIGNAIVIGLGALILLEGLDRQPAAFAIGTVNLNAEPRPSSLSTQMRPPCPSTMWRAIDSPRPVPPCPRSRALSAL